MARVFAAVDIGASGGRVMAGLVQGGTVRLEPVHRFANAAVESDGHLRWDLSGLFDEVLFGLGRLAADYPQVESIGIDTWAVDYGLLGRDGSLLAEPVAYRDSRTEKVIERVHRSMSEDDLYERTGLQFLPFTTRYQLAAEHEGPHWDDSAHIVLLPDLLAYWLTGILATEATNASTTGLVDQWTGDWWTGLLDALDLPRDRFSTIVAPGTVRGRVKPDLCERLGLDPTVVVTTVGSHDTASAVVGVPAQTDRFAYIASGTWSLVGLELDGPILNAGARDANFTNELGVDRRTRFLRNVGGLWLLQEAVRTWELDRRVDLDGLLAEAAALPPGGPVVDVDDPSFIPPGNMPARIAAAVRAHGGELPEARPNVVRCIIDSLAVGYARTIDQAVTLSGHPIDVIYIVGGGSQNDLLCQLTADLTGLPVLAGPVEATALGNVMVQARAHGAAPESLEGIRGVIAASASIQRYEPNHEATR